MSVYMCTVVFEIYALYELEDTSGWLNIKLKNKFIHFLIDGALTI
jgi:hypothetical protein